MRLEAFGPYFGALIGAEYGQALYVPYPPMSTTP